MAVRPRLKTRLRPLRRGPGSVQFGVTPEHGVVIEGLLPAEITLLGRLDGTHDMPGLYAVALTSGVGRCAVDELLATLSRHRLLVEQPTDRAFLSTLSESVRSQLGPDADDLAASSLGAGDGFAQIAARAAYHVVVVGTGGLPDAISSVLTCAGVGRVSSGYPLSSLTTGQPRRPGAPSLVVLTGHRAVTVDAGVRLLESGVAHLPVVSLGHRVVIGPLVRPGAGPCLRCLDLHRRDRDPAWPMVLAQLMAEGRPPAAVRAETAVTAVAAGLTAMIVHRAIDGDDLPAGTSVEVGLPSPRVEHRRWTTHPLCGCSGPEPAVVAERPPGRRGAVGSTGHLRETMAQ